MDEDIERLEEIREKMTELLEEAEYMVRINGNKWIHDRAKSYWIPHIKTALSNDTEYLGKSMVTMEDTIKEIKVLKEEETDEMKEDEETEELKDDGDDK